MMTPELLRRICAAYDKSVGQTRLAEALGVGGRTMRRWLAGDAQPPAGIASEIERALRIRMREISAQWHELAALTEQQADRSDPAARDSPKPAPAPPLPRPKRPLSSA